MKSKRPYIINAMYQWMWDNHLTPYITVDVSIKDVMVPMHLSKDGVIILNLSGNAINNLEITDEAIMFSAAFSGVKQNIYVPLGAVLAIYAQENGDGVMLGPEKASEPTAQEQPQQVPPKRQKPNLRIVK